MVPSSLTEIQSLIEQHPIVLDLRGSGKFRESRGYETYSQSLRETNLTAGSLAGPNMIPIPPYIFTDHTGGGSLISIFYLGTHVSGYPGIVHGGLLATILDEGLGWCCFPSLPGNMGATAALEIDFLNSMPTDSLGVRRAWTKSVVERKAWVEGHIETLSSDGALVIAKARALFVAPKKRSLDSFT